VVQEELREYIRAKKSGEAPPATVFGTPQEAQALAPVVNDRRRGRIFAACRRCKNFEPFTMNPKP